MKLQVLSHKIHAIQSTHRVGDSRNCSRVWRGGLLGVRNFNKIMALAWWCGLFFFIIFVNESIFIFFFFFFSQSSRQITLYCLHSGVYPLSKP